jgi:hypothetical protein
LASQGDQSLSWPESRPLAATTNPTAGCSPSSAMMESKKDLVF